MSSTNQHKRSVNILPFHFHIKRYFSAAFIDISQAFDKVWHTGLLYKLKRAFLHPDYTLLKSYHTDRRFQLGYQEEYTKIYTIQSGVPQGSILGPILYSVFTADPPATEQTMTATYSDSSRTQKSHYCVNKTSKSS
jgi:hypothetical protein